jgi:hypothetical protein
MSVTLKASGTQTATLDTEHTLTTITDAGVYVLKVDTANLANGETLRLRIYTKCLSDGTERLAYEAIYKHAQGVPMKYSVPVAENISFRATLLQSGGTGRNYPWAILQVG